MKKKKVGIGKYSSKYLSSLEKPNIPNPPPIATGIKNLILEKNSDFSFWFNFLFSANLIF